MLADLAVDAPPDHPGSVTIAGPTFAPRINSWPAHPRSTLARHQVLADMIATLARFTEADPCAISSDLSGRPAMSWPCPGSRAVPWASPSCARAA